MKDIAIMDAFPVYEYEKIVLDVGCRIGRLAFHLAEMGYRVYATDIEKSKTWQKKSNLTFHLADIFNLESFPVEKAPVVICSQVLEHLHDWELALSNLLKLTEARLIITVPYKRSFHTSDHVNFWDDPSIGIFTELCLPYSVAISKIRTKPEDVERHQWNYLIVVDKRQG